MDERSSAPGRRWPWLLLAVVVVTAAAAGGWWVLRPRPNVVLITIDTQRADRIGAYGYKSNETPALDRLAKEGMLFEHAYCDVPWTTGSMASVMTGQYSGSHGVQVPNAKLKPEAVTLAELLHSEGYHTAAIIGSFPLDSVYGLDQGFESYDDQFDLPIYSSGTEAVRHVESQIPDSAEAQGKFLEEKFRNDAYRSDESVTDAAVQWVRQRLDDRPFFLWVHYFGPHEKLTTALGFAAQEPEIVKAYDADVEATDKAVGRFIDSLREKQLLDQTLVIVHADHGQNLGEHGYVGHGIRLDEASMRIPMILRYPPAIPAGLRRMDAANNLDIAPTVLEAARMDVPAFVGRSLMPSRHDPEGRLVPAEKQTVFFETMLATYFPTPIWVPPHSTVLAPVHRQGVRTPIWRLLSDHVVGPCVAGSNASRDSMGTWSLPDPKPLDEAQCRTLRANSLYAVSAIGDREPDVARDFPDVVTELDELIRAHSARKAPLASELTLSPEQEEKLRSLGYIK
jgi:arylsulfatase A-like enzyme